MTFEPNKTDYGQVKNMLHQLEEKRMAFARSMKEQGILPEKTLYMSQEDGSLFGIGIGGSTLYLITGPSLGSEEEYTCTAYESWRASLREEFKEPKGMGGVLGFGERGGRYWFLDLILSDRQVSIQITPNSLGVEELEDKKNKLFSEKPLRGNFLWLILPKAEAKIKKMLEEWAPVIGFSAE